MRSTFILLVAAISLTACSILPFVDDEGDRPTAAMPQATTSDAGANFYEIKDADRGLVRRVKVLLNGRTVDTLVLSKTRTEASSYCCTEDGCQAIEAAKACTTFKMTCDTDGTCKKYSTAAGNGRL